MKHTKNRTKDSQKTKSMKTVGSIIDGFFVLDRNWCFSAVNMWSADNKEIKPEAFVGQCIWEKFPQFKGTELELRLNKGMVEGQPQIFQLQDALSGKWYAVRIYPSGEGVSVFWHDITIRQKAKESVEESEEKFRSLVEQSIDGIVMVDARGMITEWNQAEEKITGLNRNEVLGHPLWEVNYMLLTDEAKKQISSEDMKSSMLRMISSRQSRLLSTAREYDIVRSNGVRRTVVLSLFLVSLKNDFLVGSITRDITEHKRAEEALLESEQLHRALFQNSIDSVVVSSGSGIIYAANEAALRMFGISEEEFKRAGWEAVLDKSDPRLVSALEERASTGRFRGELNFKRKDGTVFPAEVSSSLFTGQDGQPRAAFIIRDISERKQAEEALARAKIDLEARVEERTAELAESEEKYRQVVENANEVIAIVQDGIIKFISGKVIELTGFLPEEMLSKPFLAVVHADDRELAAEVYLKYVTGEIASGTYEFRVVMKNGNMRWAQMNAANITWAKKPAVLAMFTDITERKTMEQQLRAYARRITEVQEEERKRIAYELHDDTAQYLSILKMQLEALAHSGKIRDQELFEKLEYLERDADRAFNDVRRYSHELRPVVLERFGLLAALEQIADDFTKLGQLSVEVRMEGKEPQLTEEIKLGFFRIAQEALNNSRKHARASRSTIDVKFQENRLEMTVSDNGTGFDVREASARTEGKDSLGLVSMQERALQIGAELEIKSRLGKGTTISARVKL